MHSGDSACAIPPPTLSGTVLADHRDPHPRPRRRARRARAAQRAVRGEGRRRLRPRGQPACQPHRPVRQQGDGRAAREARRPGHGRARRSTSCAPKGCSAPSPASATSRVKEAVLPFDRFPERRHRPRSRDALHRRGDGHRPLLRPGVRQEPGRRREPPPRGRHRLPLPRRPRQGRGVASRRGASPSSGSASSRRPAPPTSLEAARAPRRHGRLEGGGAPRRRDRRGRAHLLGQGRPRREHAARSRPACRRRPTSGAPRRATGSRASPPSPPRRPRPRGIAERAAHEPRVRALQDHYRQAQLRLDV